MPPTADNDAELNTSEESMPIEASSSKTDVSEAQSSQTSCIPCEDCQKKIRVLKNANKRMNRLNQKIAAKNRKIASQLNVSSL